LFTGLFTIDEGLGPETLQDQRSSRPRPPWSALEAPVRYRARQGASQNVPLGSSLFDSPVRWRAGCSIQRDSMKLRILVAETSLPDVRWNRYVRKVSMCLDYFRMLAVCKLAHTQYKRLLLSNDTRSKLNYVPKLHLIPFYSPYAHTTTCQFQHPPYTILQAI
jgi:hypothetical protein